MSIENPKAAVDALLEAKNTSSTIYPMTIARYALLELVKSPIVTRSESITLESIIPTLFIMSLPIERLKGYKSKNADLLVDEAFVWADGQTDISLINLMLEEVVFKTKQLNTVAPSGKKAQATSQQMAG